MEMCAGCVTVTGNYRKKNQDRAVCLTSKNSAQPFGVACVCDGIGSLVQSEDAAELVTSGISRWFLGMKELYPDRIDEETMAEDLEMTIRELNEIVWEEIQEKGVQMGCTMSALFLTGKRYYLYHVGDSRIYLARDVLWQMTRDEVAVTPGDGRLKRYLANYMGKKRRLWLNTLRGSAENGDLFLLGTDGLFKRLSEEDYRNLQRMERTGKEAQRACEALVERVLERGETDNVSCVLLGIGMAR